MERVEKLLKFPADLAKEIEEYQKENYIPYFTNAVYELVRKGLKSDKSHE